MRRCSASSTRFRAKQIPLDAVIYLGTGFAPRGWNTRQPSFDFHPDVFKRDPAAVIEDMHDRNVKVVVHMVPWDRDKLPTLHGSIPARPGETLDAIAHPELLAAARAAREDRHRRLLARRGRLVQPARAHQAPSALLPGSSVDRTERAAVEPAAQRLPRHRPVGRLGLVGRHRLGVEDARSADRRRPQLLAQHRTVLGLGHRRLLSQPRADRRALRALVAVRRVLRLVPRPRPRLVDAPAVGLGRQRRRAAARTATTTRRSRPTIARNILAVGAEQPGDRAGGEEIHPSCAISSCPTPTRWRGKRATSGCR